MYARGNSWCIFAVHIDCHRSERTLQQSLHIQCIIFEIDLNKIQINSSLK
jgi:hypothetical protein